MASPSPSMPIHFPSPSPKRDIKPNAHPYAIKTTSTALLSRSTSSSSSHASGGPHHYVPTSPSPTSHSPVKHHRPARHRYSRSLTSDLPHPLPAPPSANDGNGYRYTSSPSPTQMRDPFAGELDDEDNTPRRRIHRAETLPSSAMAPTSVPQQQQQATALDLPDDPKAWMPSQLSSYLALTLHAGSDDVPPPVAKDIASFVREKSITGRAFLRLSEDDLVQFGINPLWRKTLLTASRSLRHNALRGRIWGFGHATADTTTFPTIADHDREEEDTGNISSSSSTSSTHSNSNSAFGAKRSRSRCSSSASESSGGGRVRDMVDSLERTFEAEAEAEAEGEFDEEGTASEYGMRSGSPIRRQYGHGHQHPASPSKQRGLPHRGAVNDLFFNASVGGSTNVTNVSGKMGSDTVPAAVEEKEADETIMGIAKRNVNGREARLLPFPPGPPLPYPSHGHHAHELTPTHTGAAYALPPSPAHAHEEYFIPPQAASDYELGFRHANPNAQVYVVRHNPSPSNVPNAGDALLENDSSAKNRKGKRLLPYPPVVGQAELHHPRPRRLVGVGGSEEEIDTGYESAEESTASDVGGNGNGTTTGTEEYETAMETQSESGMSVVSGRSEEEELSMAELLRAEGTGANPITGVEAWEMELGETVKRIDRGAGAGRADTGGAGAGAGGWGSVSEIGCKAGRAAGTRGKGKDTGKGPAIMALFVPEAEEEAEERLGGGGQEEQKRDEEEKDEREANLAQREKAVERREATVESREAAVQQREDDVRAFETEFLEKEAAFEDQCTVRSAGLQERAEELELREQAVVQREDEVGKKELEIKQKEDALRMKEVDISQREVEVARKEAEVRQARRLLEERDLQLQEEKEQREAKERMDAALWPVPVDLLRKCWGAFVLPIVGEERTPAFLSYSPAAVPKPTSTSTLDSSVDSAPDTDRDASRPASPTNVNLDASASSNANANASGDLNPSRPKSYLTTPWKIRRDMFLGRMGRLSGGYIVLMSIGVCVIVLRALGMGRRVGGLVGGRK